MTRAIRPGLPRVGDVFRIEAFDDEDVLVHYVRRVEGRGPLVCIYRGPKSREDVRSLALYEKLFGPVLCGVNPPVRTGAWTKVGEVAPPEGALSPFLAANGGRPPYDPPFWLLVDLENDVITKLGDSVPVELRGLEVQCVWPGDLIEERVRSGVNEYSYEQTMSHFH